MDLVVVFGPLAVGKMTVGAEITRLTGFPLFHNHMTIEPLLGVFAFGSPQFGRLVSEFRQRVMEEARDSGLAGLVFTYAWDVADEADRAVLKGYVDRATVGGGRALFVELSAPQEVRLVRNEGASRLDHKRSKRDLAWSRQHLVDVESHHVLSTGPGRQAAHDLLDEHPYLRIDNTDLEPEEVAELVVEHFGLPRQASSGA